MIKRPSAGHMVFLVAGFMTAGIGCAVSAYMISYTSETSFCISCHEMRIVAEQGWKQSAHYQNDEGVVAQCSDCHIPHALIPKLWTKTRDGVNDIAVHLFGESDPVMMPWDELGQSARRKVYDSSCRRCHVNLTPRGAAIKTIIAHREYLKMKDRKRCLDCHRKEFHGAFREYLFNNSYTAENGDLQ
ncbi:NapC/NirT family cytochrome c [bacterium]|nr:NapC/NirT family cytochrome c [bacterium]